MEHFNIKNKSNLLLFKVTEAAEIQQARVHLTPVLFSTLSSSNSV